MPTKKAELYGRPSSYPYYVKAYRENRLEGYSGTFRTLKAARAYREAAPFGRAVSYRIIDRRR